MGLHAGASGAIRRGSPQPLDVRARPRRSRAAFAPTLCGVLMLCTAACGGSSTSAGSNTSTSTSASRTGSSSASRTGSTRTSNRPVREYPAGGPTDPVFPPGKDVYPLIASGSCAELLDDTQGWRDQGVPDAEGASTTPLYMSAAYACLGRWDDARRTYAQIDVAHPDFARDTCARTALLGWLTALIEERNSDPNFSPVFVKSSAPSPCPQEGPTTTTTATSQTGSTSADVTTSTSVPSSTTTG